MFNILAYTVCEFLQTVIACFAMQKCKKVTFSVLSYKSPVKLGKNISHRHSLPRLTDGRTPMLAQPKIPSLVASPFGVFVLLSFVLLLIPLMLTAHTQVVRVLTDLN